MHKILQKFFSVSLDRLTIADMALAPLVMRCLAFPIEEPGLPELSRWAKAMESRTAFAVATGAKPSALNAA